jgi:glycosyltransferase involved in cell wall biosynthesis
MNPFISICIPTYKRIQYLKRLLNSIAIQSFKDFEVIITDDSPSADVNDLCDHYKNIFQINYYKNPLPLGTPENWNESIRHAEGKWIKLMHDDDWFTNENSLSVFANAAKQNSSLSFFYSAYTNVFEDDRQSTTVYLNSFRKRKLERNPVTLFSRNVIGPPSVTLVKNDKLMWYDNKIKWVVDIDFYIRYLKKNPSFYIDQPLINVGINKGQVTQSSFRVANIEIPESFYLLSKIGVNSLKNILVYDGWWRLIRNLRVTSLSKVSESGYKEEVPRIIESMINWQSKIPSKILRVGVFSKFIMFVHYLTHRRILLE